MAKKMTPLERLKHDRMREKARLLAYYQGLNIRLQNIAADLSRIDAQNEVWEKRSLAEKSEAEELEHLYRIVYAARLKKESDEIRKITNP